MFTHLLIFTKVDGVWGTWAAWSTCSVTCGNGMQTRDRNCEFPPNAARGENCTGPSTVSQSCVLTPCHSEYFSGVRSITCCCFCLCLTRLLQKLVVTLLLDICKLYFASILSSQALARCLRKKSFLMSK